MRYLELVFAVSLLINTEDAAGDTNVAFNKPVTLSSLYEPGTPGSLAVDGNKTGHWQVDGCACSLSETNPWILVDLEKDYKISSLYLLNRQDSHHGNWTDWGDWSSCSKSCGNGSASRSRSCGGSNCCGGAVETITCNDYPCPDSINDGFCSYEPHDCQDIDTIWSGIYHVTPLGTFTGFDVYCDMVTDGGGWLVFQRRVDDSIDFNKSWKDYLVGFEPVTGNHWLGLRKIKSVVAQGHYELRIDLEVEEGQHIYAKYAVFSLGELVDQYPIIVDGYTGTAGDALFKYSGTPFSAKDRDMTDTQCSTTYESAWWFSNCSGPLLNGRYTGENTDYSDASRMHWMTTDGKSYTVMKSEMKIRRL